MDGELHDWELLTDPEDSGLINSSDTAEDMPGLDGFERESEGMLRLDYFSVDSHAMYARPVQVADDGSSVESDNPSWIDPGPETERETRYANKESGEFWTSDSSSDHSDDRRVGEFGVNSELGVVESVKLDGGFDVSGEVGAESEENSVGRMELSGGIVEGGDVVTDDEVNDRPGELLNSGEEKGVDEPKGENENVTIKALKSFREEGKSGGTVWWKLPLDFLKYCLLRASPFWTISMAAAMMGFVILGQRLYKMKRKSQSLRLNVTVDDKKISQFMSRAARLNEAFSVVKRVPIVRPSLPATGATPWPMMSLR